MWWENAIVVLAIGASLAFLARSLHRTLSGRGSCASACGGCAGAPRSSDPIETPLDFRDGFPS